MDPYQLINKYYTPDSELHHVLVRHSEQVRDLALEVARQHPEFNLDTAFIAEAAMLHDIGIFRCNAPRIFCEGPYEYIQHGYLGAEILHSEGFPKHALVCERHTGTGISLEIILERNLPLPHRDMRPISLEEQIICYADKFFSKTELNSIHSVERIRKQLNHYGEENVQIFDAWHQKFS